MSINALKKKKIGQCARERPGLGREDIALYVTVREQPAEEVMFELGPQSWEGGSQ